MNQLADALAGRLARLAPEAVCGPLVEGAFVALTVAADLEVPFLYSERIETPGAEGLFPVRYALPRVQRELVRGKRVAIVNDVINAGSAVIGAFTDLVSAGAQPIAIGSLLVLGPLIARFAQEQGVTLSKRWPGCPSRSGLRPNVPCVRRVFPSAKDEYLKIFSRRRERPKRSCRSGTWCRSG